MIKRRYISSLISYAPAMLLCLLIVAGCQRRPDHVLAEKDMVSLMIDLQLAESYTDMEYSGIDLPTYRRQLAESVLMAHNVSREELDSTLSWYGRNLDEYSKLYEKVDKGMAEKKERLLAADGDAPAVQGDFLWPYTENGVISKLGNSDGWILSVPAPELEKGDMLEWSMHLKVPENLVGILGVEYDDGSGEAVSSNFIGRKSVELKLQTDTGKHVARIYGTMRLKEPITADVFADSIRMVRFPFDSLEYRQYRNQRRYGMPYRIRKEPVERHDTLSGEGIKSSDVADSNKSAEQRVVTVDGIGKMRQPVRNTPSRR